MVVVDSDGDLQPSAGPPDLPGQGWFTSRLERALLQGQVDLAVHSAKDLPTEMAEGLVLSAYLPRADPRDALVADDGLTLERLPPHARVATSSPRRAVQLLERRPDLVIEETRGNVDTRVGQVRKGRFEACVLAQAGLARLGRGAEGCPLDPHSECTPAPAQGAIVIQARQGTRFSELARAVDDASTRVCATAERLVLQQLGGGCRLPLGVLAEPLEGGRFQLTLAWGGSPGEPVRRLSRPTSDAGPEALEALSRQLVREIA